MAGLIGATGATDAGANADAMSQRWDVGGGGGGDILAAVMLPSCFYPASSRDPTGSNGHDGASYHVWSGRIPLDPADLVDLMDTKDLMGQTHIGKAVACTPSLSPVGPVDLVDPADPVAAAGPRPLAAAAGAAAVGAGARSTAARTSHPSTWITQLT